MEQNKISNNNYAEIISRITGGRYLDNNNISWRLIDRIWIGKRSVWTFDFRAVWLEETTIENVKSWWCGGKDMDYEEIFYEN
jgi:hypothetical protein